MSVALCGLENMTFPDAPGWFEIEVVLDKPWPQEYALSEKHLRLHCSPVINLFPLESDPLHLDSLQSEYLLRPMRVRRWTHRNLFGGVRHLFTSFRHPSVCAVYQFSPQRRHVAP